MIPNQIVGSQDQLYNAGAPGLLTNRCFFGQMRDGAFRRAALRVHDVPGNAIITGRPGSGKTRLVSAVAQAVLRTNGSCILVHEGGANTWALRQQVIGRRSAEGFVLVSPKDVCDLPYISRITRKASDERVQLVIIEHFDRFRGEAARTLARIAGHARSRNIRVICTTNCMVFDALERVDAWHAETCAHALMIWHLETAAARTRLGQLAQAWRGITLTRSCDAYGMVSSHRFWG